MKKRQNQIQKQVERTLGCFETAERLQPDPRFASRVRNRIAGQAPTNNASRWPLIGTWPVASALLTLILVANLASMAVLSQHKNTQGGSPTDDLSSLASDYGYAAGETWYYLSSDYMDGFTKNRYLGWTGVALILVNLLALGMVWTSFLRTPESAREQPFGPERGRPDRGRSSDIRQRELADS